MVRFRYPEQPRTIHVVKFVTLKLVAFIQGWLFLPRHTAKLTVDTSIKTHFEPGVCPRMYPTKSVLYLPNASITECWF